ncbi:MAG: EAL domain-containing protein [Eubacteriales bacterium]|nr:EAL domain-containing protein [Eubacteriales bacterium]
MEKILKNELGLKKGEKIAIAVGLTIFLALSVVFCVCAYSDTKRIVQEQAVRSISNISQLNEESITRSVENRRLLLKTITSRLERKKIYDVEAILQELQDFQEAYDFYRIGVLAEGYVAYLTDGITMDLSDSEIVRQIWNDHFHLTKSYQPFAGGKYTVNMFSYPIHKDGKLQYVLMATYYSKNLTERMNLSSMEGKGHTFLLNRQGEVVIYPHHYENAEYNALMKYINDTPGIVPAENGDQSFEYNGESYYAHFEKLGFNNWYLMTCAKEKDVFADAYAIMHVVFLAAGVLWGIIACVICGIFLSIRRNKKSRIRTTFYDELLGIGNGNALSVCYKNLPEKALEDLYLVVFDIDKFKEFNYIYGEEIGDGALKYIVRVFREEMPDVYLFRYFSDYFIMLDQCGSETEYEKKIGRVLDRFALDIKNKMIQPFDISAGVRKVERGESLRRIISDALIARGTIKGNHLRHHAFYDDEIRFQRIRYMEMESDFSRALREKEFRVYYQPKYDICTGEIIGAEALSRWIREDGTILSPAIFIPCFEESRQVILLDEYMLEEVCRQMGEMEAEGLEVKPVSVNLSRVHLRQFDTLYKIASIIEKSGVSPSNLSFEITESALMEESIPVKDILDHLHHLGCRVDMDDYGVGASNPDTLISNHFDVLKLDRSFVERIGDERAEDFIRSTTQLVMKWGMEVLAEGVEEKYQAERLVELGCTYAQGFYYSKPIPEKEYRELLRRKEVRHKVEQKMPVPAKCFSEEVCALLDGNLLPTYIIDPERFTVMYCNRAMRSYMKNDPTGGLCYEKVRGRDKPCEGCSAMRFYRNGDNSPKEIRSPMGGWALLQTSPLYWEGRQYIQITGVDITKQKQMEAELHLRSKEYEVIVQQSLTGIMRYDIATDTASVNVDRNLERVEEYTISNYVQTVIDSGMLTEDGIAVSKRILSDIQNGMPSKGYDLQFSLERTGLCWCRLDYTLIHDDEGRPSRAVISLYDNTEQKEKEMEYHSWSSSLSALIGEYTIYVGVNLSQDIIESENRFGQWNYAVSGRSFGDFTDRVSIEWVAPDYIAQFRNFLNRERLLGMYYAGQREGVLEYQTMRDGKDQWFRLEMQMVSDPSSNDVKASLIFNNVDAVVRERERLRNEAERDSMTGLYNRATSERLIQEVMEKNTGERCCFLIIDLDDLRGINSSFGHPEGDKALKAIASAMSAKFRKGDILGRIGGDEFVVLLRNVPEADGLRNAISTFLCRIRKIKIGPMNDRPIHVSVGGTIGTAGKDDFKTLYEQADLALYYTKATGKNAFNFYVPEMENREFVYQPHSTLTIERVDWYESAEFKKLLHAMAAFFPLVISVNLTRNTYYMMEYMAYTTQRAKDEGSFDELIADGAATFHPEDREGFLAAFQRENLLRAYGEGKRMVSHMGRQLGEDGRYRMAQTVVVFLEEETTGDICEITFTHVMAPEEDVEEAKDDGIFRFL